MVLIWYVSASNKNICHIKKWPSCRRDLGLHELREFFDGETLKRKLLFFSSSSADGSPSLLFLIWSFYVEFTQLLGNEIMFYLAGNGLHRLKALMCCMCIFYAIKNGSNDLCVIRQWYQGCSLGRGSCFLHLAQNKYQNSHTDLQKWTGSEGLRKWPRWAPPPLLPLSPLHYDHLHASAPATAN